MAKETSKCRRASAITAITTNIAWYKVTAIRDSTIWYGRGATHMLGSGMLAVARSVIGPPGAIYMAK